MRRCSLVLGLVLLVGVASPAPAAACGPYGGGCGGALVGVGVGLTVVALADLAVIGYDLTHALRGLWLPSDLAWGNVIYGSAHVIAGGLLVALERDEAWVGIGVYGLSAGFLMVLDGALSLALHVDGERPIGLSLGPTQGGLAMALHGQW